MVPSTTDQVPSRELGTARSRLSPRTRSAAWDDLELSGRSSVGRRRRAAEQLVHTVGLDRPCDHTGTGILGAVPTETYSRHLIRMARRNAGLTQVELAGLAKTSQAAVSAYESGRRSPSVETLCRILDAAGFEVRMRLVESDRHDATRAVAESLLPSEDLAAFNERERRRVARRRARTSDAAAARV